MIANELNKKTKTRRCVDFAEVTRLMGSLNLCKPTNRRMLNRLLDSLERKYAGRKWIELAILRMRSGGPARQGLITKLIRGEGNEKW